MTPVAVVLARGLGTRMRASGAALDDAAAKVADSGVKALIPDAQGRPFLDYVLSDLADAGCREAVLVIGPEHDALREAYTGRCKRIAVSFAIQSRPLGTADALAAAGDAVAGRDCILVNSDNRYPVAAIAGLVRLTGPGLVGFRRSGLLRGNIDAGRVAKFAAISLNGDGTLARIVEKPDPATLAALGADPLLSMNCWRFDAGIFATCRAVSPSPRGELELPDAVTLSMRAGTRYVVVESREAVLDLSSRDDV
nr:NTP transferase domain-containing protein [Planctomycetota bacterium]